ncbi:DUF4244 domain-containing protein [Tersicoccus sp. Bi-70]|uniref:DUF4244 domain-containing protein n=1 Tax=Tersicoccus sp. Bi-70 TaxID=1897634 RepID=UPI001E2C8F62|nr:DUF4244 domain-containing protein [Tersicoccus sp. Bi-70]
MSHPALHPALTDLTPDGDAVEPSGGSAPGTADGSLRADHPGATRSTLEHGPGDHLGGVSREHADDRGVIRLDQHRARRHPGGTTTGADAGQMRADADSTEEGTERRTARWRPRHARRRLAARMALCRRVLRGDDGMATAEYAIATLAAVGFAGLLVLILKGNEVKGLLTAIIRQALGG